MASLRFKKDGTPFVDFYAHGRRHRPEFLKTKDAQAFLRLADASPEEAYRFWQDSVAQSAPAAVTGCSFREKIEAFKVDYCSKRANARDMCRIMSELLTFVLKRHAAEDIDMREVTLEDLGAFQTHILSWGIENASVNRYFSTVKTFFKRAQKAQYITVNYAQLVEGLAVEFVQRESVWQDGDTQKLVDYLMETEKSQALIDIANSMEFTPFGPIDFKRLKWRAIDLQTGFVRTFRMKGKGRRDWNVPIVLGYHRLLLEIRRRHEALGLGGSNDYVYTDASQPISTAAVSKALERARKAVGIESVPYTSRHRAITMVEKKAGLKTASKFGGHASTKTTERHYVVGGEEDFKNKVKEAFAE